VRALVTGAAGFVGRHLTSYLLARGHEVAGLVHPSDGGAGLLGENVEIFSHDILDHALLSRSLSRFAPDVIFHLAAYSNPEGSWREARRTLEINIIGTHNLLAAASEAGKPRILLVGSAQQYGQVPAEAQPIAEDREQRPLTPYAVSKTSQEYLGRRMVWSEELPVLMTRSFNHTGPGQADSYVCASFARQVVEVEKGLREPVIRVGNLGARRDFTDVRDVTAAYHAIVERGRPGTVYNVCRGEAVSIREVLDRLIGLSRTPVEVVVDPERYHSLDVPLMVGDPGLVERDTGWAPQYSLETTLRDMLEDWRSRV
jgi:GDP-4-dehydro-6-deoxy-D-mannose reductase